MGNGRHFSHLVSYGLLVVLLRNCDASPPSPLSYRIVDATYGEDVVIKCVSNEDNDHLFDCWLIDSEARHMVIGPANEEFDVAKFDYEVLSGNLTIRYATYGEQGFYTCVSRGVRNVHVQVEKTKLIVSKRWEDVYEHDPNINLIRILIVLITLVLLMAGAYVAYSMYRDRHRYPRYLENEVDDDDDESAEEIFSAPSTSGLLPKLKSPKIVKDRRRSDDVSTDFKSILDTANDE